MKEAYERKTNENHSQISSKQSNGVYFQHGGPFPQCTPARPLAGSGYVTLYGASSKKSRFCEDLRAIWQLIMRSNGTLNIQVSIDMVENLVFSIYCNNEAFDQYWIREIVGTSSVGMANCAQGGHFTARDMQTCYPFFQHMLSAEAIVTCHRNIDLKHAGYKGGGCLGCRYYIC